MSKTIKQHTSREKGRIANKLGKGNKPTLKAKLFKELEDEEE